MSKVPEMMAEHGYWAMPQGSIWVWVRETDDGSILAIGTQDDGIEGDPAEPEWHVTRYSDVDNGFVRCRDLMPLADVLALASRLGSPKARGGAVELTLSRRELEDRQ